LGDNKISEGECVCVYNPRNKQYYLFCREKGEKRPTIKRKCTPEDLRKRRVIENKENK